MSYPDPHPRTNDDLMVDVNIPRFNQAVIALVTALAFVLQLPWLVGVAFALLAVSVLLPDRAPLSRLYVDHVRPRVEPNGPSEFESAAPPRFAQRIGAIVLGLAVALFFFGATTAGWAATLVVTALATLAAATRICVGCILYERVVAR